MIEVTVHKQSAFPVSATAIKKVVAQTFKEHGIVSDAEASVAIVNEAKMLTYVKEFLGEEGEIARAHPVLSFPTNEIEGQFSFPPDNVIHLGEIIVSYPKAVEDAAKMGKHVEEVICDLAAHGALHLIGIHHD